MQTTQPAAAEQQNCPSKPFIHQPHPPCVPDDDTYSSKHRSFSRGNENRQLRLAADDYNTSIRVFRWANADCARLIVETSSKSSATHTMVQFTAAELREIAARLLDAAHDLDAFPASVLMGGGA